MMIPSTFPAMLQHFFTDRLRNQMEASPNTIAGYRDTFRLFLRFASEKRSKDPTKLRIEDLDVGLVGDFLHHVETVRKNTARSRNVRLTAIRSFFRYVAMSERPICSIVKKFWPCRANDISGEPWIFWIGRRLKRFSKHLIGEPGLAVAIS